MQPDDTTLIEQARRGDEAAFRILVERYQNKIFAMALHVLRDPDDARDVVQDAFVKAYRGLASFQGNAAFYTWLYRIAMNLCIDRSRASKRSSKVEFDETINRDEEGDSGISPQRLGFDPARALADGEIRLHVNRSLAQLSEAHRTALLLREVEGLSYKEIADAVGCTEGTVMSRLFHARKKMQEMLRPIVTGDEGAQTVEGGEGAEGERRGGSLEAVSLASGGVDVGGTSRRGEQ